MGSTEAGQDDGKTLIVTAIAQVVVNANVDFLAESMAEYHREGRHDLLEVDDGTYINPIHIITMGAAGPAPEPTPELVRATGLPPGMARG